MLWRSRSAAYSGLIAAPGTPKAWVMPSFSITSTAAIAAFIFAIVVSVEVELPGRMFGRRGLRRKGPAGDISYSTQEWQAAMAGPMRVHRERVARARWRWLSMVAVQAASSGA